MTDSPHFMLLRTALLRLSSGDVSRSGRAAVTVMRSTLISSHWRKPPGSRARKGKNLLAVLHIRSLPGWGTQRHSVLRGEKRGRVMDVGVLTQHCLQILHQVSRVTAPERADKEAEMDDVVDAFEVLGELPKDIELPRRAPLWKELWRRALIEGDVGGVDIDVGIGGLNVAHPDAVIRKREPP